MNNDSIATAAVTKKRTRLAIVSLALALPFPIMVSILWLTIITIKEQNVSYSNVTMNAVFLYLVQFFIVPLLSITSIITAFMVTLHTDQVPKRIGYVSLAITGIGFILMGLFLNNS